MYIASIIGVAVYGKVLYLSALLTAQDVPLAILQLYATDVGFKLCIVKYRNMLRPVMSMVQIVNHKGLTLHRMLLYQLIKAKLLIKQQHQLPSHIKWQLSLRLLLLLPMLRT